jgi:PAS domain S-box-containing protein
VKDEDRPRKELIKELDELRQRVVQLESESFHVSPPSSVGDAHGTPGGASSNEQPRSAYSQPVDNDATESIDLSILLTKELTDSGSFDIRGDIWATTFGKVLQALPIPAFLLDRSFRVFQANQACQILADTHEEMLGRAFGSLFCNPATANKAQELVQTVYNNRKQRVCEAWLTTATHRRWGRMSLRSIRIMEERFVLVLLEDLTSEHEQLILRQQHQEELQREINERKRSELALADSEQKYRALAELLPQFVYEIDSSGKFTFVNQSGLDASGYSWEDFKAGIHAVDVVVPKDRKALVERMGRILTGQKLGPHEFTLLRKDGSRSPFMAYSTPIVSGENVEGIRGVAVDISERKKAEEVLRESENRFRAIFANNHSAMLIIDPMTAHIEDANPRACTFYGYTLDELTKKSITEINTLSADDVFKEMQRAKSEERTYFSFKHRLRNGEIRDVEVYSGPITMAKRELLYSIINDVTDRKAAEEALLQMERLSAVADLASGVAHHFNNMLQIVLGGASVAQTNLETGNLAGVKSQLDHIVASSRFGAETVKHLQGFVKLAHEEDRPVVSLDLSRIAHQAIETTRIIWRTEPEKRGIKVDIIPVLDDGCTVKGSESELFEVMTCLIKNAVEAMPAGGQIRIETSVEQEKAVLRIIDSGVGIPKENLAKLFDPFFTTKGVQRTGMGLAGCYGIVKTHGGTISVESDEGVGSAVTIELPFVLSPVRAAEVADIDSVVKRMRILLVDDMESVLMTMKEGLSGFGQTVITAISGSQAMMLCEEDIPDIVISDLGMPGMNGWEVGRRIKDLCEQRGIPKIPFILLTGWDRQSQEKHKIIESGVDAVLEKPVDLARLVSLIREIAESCPGQSHR